MSEATASLVAAVMEAWNTYDVERLASFYALDYEGLDINDAVPQRGPQGIQRMVKRYRDAFPDVQFTAEEVIVQGERVALVWTAQGTHQGRLMNIPPTGRQVTVRGVSVLTVKDGQVRRGLYIWDLAGLLRGIGLLPEL
jgi:steroid delta-isomerase-like uncharacterized protein